MRMWRRRRPVPCRLETAEETGSTGGTKRLTHPANTHTDTHHHGGGGGGGGEDADRHAPDAAGSSPFPSATSLFSPDVSSKMASDLLIRLSEATQKAQVHPGRSVEAEPQLEVRGGQQDEPGLALSPDGPGASPEPPTLSHTPDGSVATETMASDMLRKLAGEFDLRPVGGSAERVRFKRSIKHTCFPPIAERQEVNGVKVKEEEEPMEVDALVASKQTPPSSVTSVFSVKTEDLPSSKTAEQLHPRAKMADQRLHGLKTEDTFYTTAERSGAVSGANTFHLRVKTEDRGAIGAKMADKLQSGAKMEDQLLFKAKIAKGSLSSAKTNRLLSGAKMEEQILFGAKMETGLLPGSKMEEQLLSGVAMENQLLVGSKMGSSLLAGAKMEDQLLFGSKTENGLFPGAKMADHVFSGVKMEEQQQFFFGAKMDDQLAPGAKMADQCLRAVLWQDMSVNLASTLLHQLSEKVSKSSSRPAERSTPPTRSSPVLKVDVDSLRCSPLLLDPQDPPHETKSSLSRDQNSGRSFFYRCHVCGFETDAPPLFQSHMTEHRQWERASFSLHCCACDHSTNQEAEMRAHAATHVHSAVHSGVHSSGDVRCPPTAASGAAASVAVATQPENNGSAEHRCRICQRSFPGQQELLVHFQGHRQGNQYRCERCGHLTRTANKLVEHVRVHTGERPFTCALCPYSAKRRDSLRLHCKVKHPGHVHAHRPPHAHVHVHVHGEGQQVQRLPPPSSPLTPLHPSLAERAGWRELSPLLPITTLLSLKPRCPSPPSSSPPSSSPSSSSSPPSSSPPSSSKQSFLSYLGLTTSS
ncbi:uncharacterized protein V6R79_005874 [Siganus canaliculatus]